MPNKICSARFYETESAFLRRLLPGRTEAATAALSRRERHHGNEFRLDHGSDHHLRDALAAPNRKRRIAVIDQEHADLAAIIGVNGAGRVQHRDAMLSGKTGARPDLR